MMTCVGMEERLNDFADGLLSGSEREEVERHLDGCASCREALESLTSLRERTAALPRSLEPPRDLWPGVEEALAKRGAALRAWFGRDRRPVVFRSWGPGLAAAAALLLLLSVGIVTVTRRPHDPGPAGRAGGADLSGPAVLASFQQVENEYHSATQELLAMLETRREALSPETLAVVEENLRIINEAIGRMRLAVENDPDRPGNRQLVASLYRTEIELLQQAIRLSMQTRKEKHS